MLYRIADGLQNNRNDIIDGNNKKLANTKFSETSSKPFIRSMKKQIQISVVDYHM